MNNNYFLHDAEHRTESWKYRHSPDAIAQLGVWRWKEIQENASAILGIICGKRVIDFGGADGPLGFGSIVVDEKVEHKTLSDVQGELDVIFTSHAIEHLEDAKKWINDAFANLNRGGVVIIHVPAHTCRRWRKGSYANPNQASEHKHTFALSTDVGLPDGDWYDRIDSMVSLAGFSIESCEYVGDDSILVIARKQ
jgi:hypothetical protein